MKRYKKKKKIPYEKEKLRVFLIESSWGTDMEIYHFESFDNSEHYWCRIVGVGRDRVDVAKKDWFHGRASVYTRNEVIRDTKPATLEDLKLVKYWRSREQFLAAVREKSR